MKKKNKREGEIYSINTKRDKEFIKKELKKIKDEGKGFRTLGVDSKNQIVVKKYYPPKED